MSPLNVLVIEDDEDSSRLVVTLVEEVGHLATSVTNGAKAFEMVSTGEYDICIVDIALPDMDGWQFLQALRQNPDISQIPCIAITAYHDSAVEDRAMEIGFNAYFAKPFDPMSFIRQIEMHAINEKSG